ncbi:hypothetical protein [uncultured Mediterranean phage uvMED]|nr:hypothetical protein [uncultured Mediterranean phage uvMED]BAR37099.1 hypothetical protein [uncultured Mediterranean phage uvMED]
MVGRPSKKIPCGARRKYDGNPCQAKALENGRCKFHGGMSTGAKTIEGKRKAYSNLRQYKNNAKRLEELLGQDPGGDTAGEHINLDNKAKGLS